MINIEMDMRTAAAVRQSLFTDTRDYTYEVKYCPQRVLDIRSVIISIDNQSSRTEKVTFSHNYRCFIR